MPADPAIPVQFNRDDILSAQRLRILKSTRIKVVAGLWAALELFLIIVLLVPGLRAGFAFVSPALAAGIAIAFVVVMALFYWLAPILDYERSDTWRTPFVLKLGEEDLFLGIEGKARGSTVAWKRFTAIHHNDRAYVLYIGGEANFLILPKAILRGARERERFIRLLKSKSSIPTKDKETLA